MVSAISLAHSVNSNIFISLKTLLVLFRTIDEPVPKVTELKFVAKPSSYLFCFVRFSRITLEVYANQPVAGVASYRPHSSGLEPALYTWGLPTPIFQLPEEKKKQWVLKYVTNQ